MPNGANVLIITIDNHFLNTVAVDSSYYHWQTLGLSPAPDRSSIPTFCHSTMPHRWEPEVVAFILLMKTSLSP